MRLNRCSTTFQFWAVGTRPVKTTISPTISSAVSSWYQWTWGKRPSIMHHVGHPLTVPALHSRLAALKFAKRRINEYPTTRPDSSRETWRYFQVFSGHLEEDWSGDWGTGQREVGLTQTIYVAYKDLVATSHCQVITLDKHSVKANQPLLSGSVCGVYQAWADCLPGQLFWTMLDRTQKKILLPTKRSFDKIRYTWLHAFLN